MTYVYFKDKEQQLGGFDLPAVPRVGEKLSLWFSPSVAHRREEYTEEALEKFDRLEGTRWVVKEVFYEAIYNKEGRVTCRVTRV